MRSVVLGLLLTAFSIFAFAQRNSNCPAAASSRSVDISMELGPLKDQDGDGWCYAYGGADQLSHWMKNHGVSGVDTVGPGRVSPVGLALDETEKSRRRAYTKYNSDLADYKQQMNTLEATVSSALPYLTNLESKDPTVKKLCANIKHDEHGAIVLFKPAPGSASNSYYLDIPANSCHEARRKLCQSDSSCRSTLAAADAAAEQLKKMPMLTPQFHFPAGAPAKTVIESSLSRGVCLESSVASDGFNPRLGVNVNQLLTINAMNSCEACQRESSMSAVFPRFQGNVAAVLDNYMTEDPMSEFMKSCQRVQVPNPKPQVKDVKPEDFSTELERPNPEPIGVTYDPDIFNYSDPSVAATYFVPSAGKTEFKKDDTLHYSLLVGKRYNCNLGEEEFILRNSWGNDACESSRNRYMSVPATDSRVTDIVNNVRACTLSCRYGEGWRNCNESCVKTRNKNSVALQKPPFYCEDGLFIVPSSVLKRSAFYGNKIE